MGQKDEYQLQIQITDYLRLQYPNILFRSDLAGIRLPIGQATQVKRIQSDRGWPDLFIAEPRNGCPGLFLELKVSESDLYTKTGALRKSQHIREQTHMLGDLRQRGYRAEFAIGFDGAKSIIDEYLGKNYVH